MRAFERGLSLCVPVSMYVLVRARVRAGMSGEMARNMLRPPMKGMVLRAFGAGNAPDRDEHLLGALRDASAAGVVIVCVTQCPSECPAAACGRNIVKYGTCCRCTGTR